MNLLAEGKVGIMASAEPVAFTETGLRFSEGTALNDDAVLWCTGYHDRDIRNSVAEILDGSGNDDIAARVDGTWGFDSEGEIRGMWKRHARVADYWVIDGHAQQHRWYSRMLALQIKAALESILPPAYCATPAPSKSWL